MTHFFLQFAALAPNGKKDDEVNKDESLVYFLPGFSSESGLKVGLLFSEISDEVEATNATIEEVTPRLFHSSIKTNKSEFSICMRFKLHYQRPEYLLFTSYVENKTAVEIGVDEIKKEIYFKYSVSDDSDDVARLAFEWLPRLDIWEHVCFVKKPDPKEDLNQVKFFVNGEAKGQGAVRKSSKLSSL